jgi:hypothetical protein
MFLFPLKSAHACSTVNELGHHSENNRTWGWSTVYSDHQYYTLIKQKGVCRYMNERNKST